MIFAISGNSVKNCGGFHLDYVTSVTVRDLESFDFTTSQSRPPLELNKPSVYGTDVSLGESKVGWNVYLAVHVHLVPR
jgi:hypothetical protein